MEEGYAGISRTFNQDNRVTTQTYLDQYGNPVLPTKPVYATIVYDYDLQKRKIREGYYDANGNTFIPKAIGCASKTWAYNDDGKLISEQYLDTDGKLVEISNGYAGIDHSYSDDYRVEVLSYLDKSGEPFESVPKLKYSRLRKTYVENGRLVKEEYLDNNGVPTRNAIYVYGRVFEYDNMGRLIREYTFGDHGQPNSGSRNYSIIEYTYDDAGNRSATRYNSCQSACQRAW